MSSDPADRERIERVRAALAAHGIDAVIIEASDSTHTAEEAAAAAGCELGQIVKTLVVYAAGTPIFVFVAGDRRLNDRALAGRFGVGRKQIKLASAEQVLQLTGYPVGGVSPFGAPTGTHVALPALIDASFARFETIWVAAGTPRAIFPMQRADLQRLTNAEVADVST